MATLAEATPARFSAVYVRPWLSPFEIAVGGMTVALLSFLAATYLTIEAEGDRELQDDFRSRALGAAVAETRALARSTAAGQTCLSFGQILLHRPAGHELHHLRQLKQIK